MTTTPQEATSGPQAADQTVTEAGAAPETTATPQKGSEPASEGQERPDSGNREAAKYRRQLRETEAERDTLAATLAGYHRTEAERHAEAAGLHRGADLFDIGTALESLLGDDGRVDEAKVKAAVEGVLVERPHWDRRRLRGDIGQGVRESVVSGPTWQELLSDRHR